MKKIVLLVAAFAAANFAFAQRNHEGVCGTPPVDVEQLKADIALGKSLSSRGNVTTYIPVSYNLITRSNGSGGATVESLLDLFQAVNNDFEVLDIAFFMHPTGFNGLIPWDETADDGLYESSGTTANARLLNTLKAPDAVTVYVPNNANPPNSAGIGVTLGYYSPQYDYLVFRRSEIGDNSSTATHEFGHYFGLPHTFQGWDSETWNDGDPTVSDQSNITSPVMQIQAPNGRADNELVTRGAGANCATAGDLFCDTPADYNLGFGWRDCNYTGNVRDRNNEPIRPDEDNFMGYFLECSSYTFSGEQSSSMLGNYNSSRRNFLRTASPAILEPVTEDVVYTSPLDGSTVDVYDRVRISWDPVPNAQYYYVQISTRSTFSTRQVDTLIMDGATSFVVTNLEDNDDYNLRIRAFSQVSGGSWSSTVRFETGRVSSINDLPQAAESIVLSPNPAASGTSLDLRFFMELGQDLSVQVRDLTGRVVLTQAFRADQGANTRQLETFGLPSGTYVVSLTSESGLSTRKFVIE